MSRLLIAFGHKARHGKDSAAQAVRRYYPHARIFKFADALYDLCRKEYGMIEKDAPLLQRIGSEKRSENPDYWIKRLEKSIGSFKGVCLITDVRYQNEAEWVKHQGGILVNVTRLNEDGTPFVADDRPADHPSEVDLNGYNWDARIITKTGQEGLAAAHAVAIFNNFSHILWQQ